MDFSLFQIALFCSLGQCSMNNLQKQYGTVSLFSEFNRINEWITSFNELGEVFNLKYLNYTSQGIYGLILIAGKLNLSVLDMYMTLIIRSISEKDTCEIFNKIPSRTNLLSPRVGILLIQTFPKIWESSNCLALLKCKITSYLRYITACNILPDYLFQLAHHFQFRDQEVLLISKRFDSIYFVSLTVVTHCSTKTILKIIKRMHIDDVLDLSCNFSDVEIQASICKRIGKLKRNYSQTWLTSAYINLHPQNTHILLENIPINHWDSLIKLGFHSLTQGDFKFILKHCYTRQIGTIVKYIDMFTPPMIKIILERCRKFETVLFALKYQTLIDSTLLKLIFARAPINTLWQLKPFIMKCSVPQTYLINASETSRICRIKFFS